MPWKVVKKKNEDRPFQVVNEQTGRVLGKHKTKKAALTQLRAVYANTPKSEH